MKLIPFLLAISLLVNEVLQKCVCDDVLASLPLGTFSNIHKVARLTKAESKGALSMNLVNFNAGGQKTAPKIT